MFWVDLFHVHGEHVWSSLGAALFRSRCLLSRLLAFLCWQMSARDRHSWVSIPAVMVALAQTEAVAKPCSLVSLSKFSHCCLKHSFLWQN